jgi:putative restriction endonuclease
LEAQRALSCYGLFKLHYPQHAIVGGGTYVWSTSFPLSITWEAFEDKNGAARMAAMRARIEKCPEQLAGRTRITRSDVS